MNSTIMESCWGWKLGLVRFRNAGCKEWNEGEVVRRRDGSGRTCEAMGMVQTNV